MTNDMGHETHPRLIELETMLHEDGVPMDKLKEAFILVNKEVLRHPELVEVMAASDIGIVTATAKRLLNIKLETKVNKAKKPAKATTKSAKAELAAMLREATAPTNDKTLEDKVEQDWGGDF